MSEQKCNHGHLTLKFGDPPVWICVDCGASVDQVDEDNMAEESDLTTDRSGRTLRDYRELFWKAEKRNRELEARLKQTQQWRDYYRRMWHGVSVTEVEIPITDAELTNLLDKRGVAK